MILGRMCRIDRRAARAVALVFASGALIGLGNESGLAPEGASMLKGPSEVERASGKVLVPKRVRLVIDFKQTVPA